MSTILGGAAQAADRTLSVTDFDRIRVEGAFAVVVTTGRATSARLSGSQAAIEAANVEVQGRTLTIRRNRQAWGGYPGREPGLATVRVTTPSLTAIAISGPTTLTVDALRAPRVGLVLEGSGSLVAGQIVTDRLDVALSGSGRIVLDGKVADLVLVSRGSGEIDASKLIAADAKVASESAGATTLGARRSARVTATGSGNVIVIGTPACTVTATGAGRVICGR